MRKSVLQENRSGISLGLLLYTVFTVGIVLSDYLQYLLSMNYWVAVCISLVLSGSVGAWITRKEGLSRVPMTLGDGIVVGIFLLISALRSAPDNSFDVNNYHLYFQEYFGRDFINSDFFPIRSINAHYFILGDRLMWFFRATLGYRLGTILNTIVIIVSYFQLKDILVGYDIARERKLGKAIPGILLFAFFFELQIWTIDTYMIDFLAIPFIIEAFRFAVINKENTEEELVWVSLMAGCAVSIKISNAVLLLFLAVIYIVRFQKAIKVKYVVAGGVLAFSMMGIYMLVSYVVTGNPVFPYLNGLFQSEYFMTDESMNDYTRFNVRFGPQTPLQYLLWPIYMILHPQAANDIGFYTGRVLLTIAVIAVRLIQMLRKKEQWDPMYLTLSGVWFVIYLLTLAFFHGYNRYIPFLEILGGVLIGCAVVDWYCKNTFTRIWAAVVSAVILFQSGYLGYEYFVKNTELAWRESILSNPQSYLSNLQMIFHDYESGIPAEIMDDIECWGIVAENGSQAVYMKDSVPTIGLTWAVTTEKTQQMADQLREKYSDSNMYTPLTRNVFDSGIEEIGNLKYQIERIIPTSAAFIDVSDRMMLVKISPVDQNIVTSAVSISETEGTISLPAGAKDVTLFVGHDPYASCWGSDGTDLIITADNGVQTMELFREKISVDQEYASVIIPEDFLEVGAVILKLEKDYSQNGDATGDWVKVVYQYTME